MKQTRDAAKNNVGGVPSFLVRKPFKERAKKTTANPLCVFLSPCSTSSVACSGVIRYLKKKQTAKLKKLGVLSKAHSVELTAEPLALQETSTGQNWQGLKRLRVERPIFRGSNSQLKRIFLEQQNQWRTTKIIVAQKLGVEFGPARHKLKRNRTTYPIYCNSARARPSRCHQLSAPANNVATQRKLAHTVRNRFKNIYIYIYNLIRCHRPATDWQSTTVALLVR